MNSWGPELPELELLLEENTLSSSTVFFLKLFFPTTLNRGILISFLVLYQLPTTSLISWVRNQIVELQRRFCEVFALSMRYMLEVEYKTQWFLPVFSSLNTFARNAAIRFTQSDWILVLWNSSKYASNLEQWKLLGWVVSFSCDCTRLSDFLGEDYLGLEINLFVTQNMSRAERLRISVLSAWNVLSKLTGRKKRRIDIFFFF